MDLAIELQKIYDREINIEIGWFWDGGIEVRLCPLGDSPSTNSITKARSSTP